MVVLSDHSEPFVKTISDEAIETLMANVASDATNLMKAVAHEQRLLILVYLLAGEKSVGELEALLNARQASVSQQLARLRKEGLVNRRRNGKMMFYSLADERARKILELVHGIFDGAQSVEA